MRVAPLEPDSAAAILTAVLDVLGVHFQWAHVSVYSSLFISGQVCRGWFTVPNQTKAKQDYVRTQVLRATYLMTTNPSWIGGIQTN